MPEEAVLFVSFVTIAFVLLAVGMLYGQIVAGGTSYPKK